MQDKRTTHNWRSSLLLVAHLMGVVDLLQVLWGGEGEEEEHALMLSSSTHSVCHAVLSLRLFPHFEKVFF